MKMLVGVLLVATVAGTQCCDARHETFVANEEAATLCRARGGVAIVDIVRDDGNHSFSVLRQCAFPYDPKVLGERDAK